MKDMSLTILQDRIILKSKRLFHKDNTFKYRAYYLRKRKTPFKNVYTKKTINPLLPGVAYLYPLKTSENL